MAERKHDRTRSLKSWYTYGRDLLLAYGIEDAESDAHILLEYAANINRSYYYLHMHEPIDAADAELYRSLLHRRSAHEPVQYLTREAPFFGHMFYVTPDVLIPRQDTEILVEEAQKRLMPGMLLLDLCTGSGCILLTLLGDHSVQGIGSDISAAALAVAEQNRRRLCRKATWIESDLFADISGRFDMIVSNPPYIASAQIPELQPEVSEYEPFCALDGGADGLALIDRIIREACEHLRPEGWLLLEIGCDQGEAVRRRLQENAYEEIQIIRDLEGRDRVAAGRRPGTCTSRLKN